MRDYSAITDEQFDLLLADVMDTKYTVPSELLLIPGIYEVVSEELNNDVLAAWEELNPLEDED